MENFQKSMIFVNFLILSSTFVARLFVEEPQEISDKHFVDIHRIFQVAGNTTKKNGNIDRNDSMTSEAIKDISRLFC